MPRKLRADGRIQVYLFVNGTYRYAVTQTTKKDEHTGTYLHTKTIYGKLSHDLVFTPNLRYLTLNENQRQQLVFPEDWTIAPVGNLVPQDAVKRGRPSYTGAYVSRLYGNTFFLEQVATSIGLYQDLIKAIGSKQAADDILTIAFFSIISLECFNHISSYQAFQKFPSDRLLESWDVTRITQSITEQQRQDFFALRTKRTREDEWMGIDSTSFSGYGHHISDLKWGKNREGDRLRQINELVVYGVSSRLPVYYRKLPGNMVDARTLRVTLNQLADMGFRSLSLIMDRGYLSHDALEMLVKKKHTFILAAKTNLSCVDRAIGALEMERFVSTAHWIDSEGLYGTVLELPFQVTVKHEKRDRAPLQLYLFFNNIINGKKKDEIAHKVFEEREILLAMREEGSVLDHVDKKKLSHFHDVVLNEQGNLISFTENPEKIQSATRHSGFFAFICNNVSCSPEALLKLYRMRDIQEKSFDTLKTGQNGRRFRTSTELSNDGRLFIQFLSLILNSSIEYTMIKENLYATYATRKHLLESLTPIRCIERPHKQRIISEIIGSQLDIFEAFGISVPEECKPISRRKKTKKRTPKSATPKPKT